MRLLSLPHREGRGGSLPNLLIVEATEEPVAETDGDCNIQYYDECIEYIEVAESGLFVNIVDIIIQEVLIQELEDGRTDDKEYPRDDIADDLEDDECLDLCLCLEISYGNEVAESLAKYSNRYHADKEYEAEDYAVRNLMRHRLYEFVDALSEYTEWLEINGSIEYQEIYEGDSVNQ